MNPAGKLHVQALLNRFEKVHHQVMGNVEPTEREDVLVVGPFAFHQADIEAFFFEKSFFDGGKYRRFTGQTDVADADLVAAIAGIGGLIAAGKNYESDRGREYGAIMHLTRSERFLNKAVAGREGSKIFGLQQLIRIDINRDCYVFGKRQFIECFPQQTA